MASAPSPAASPASSPGSLFVNGQILSKAEVGLEGKPSFAESMFVQDGIIKAIGPREELSAKYRADGIVTRDLDGRTVLPGFVDGHMHLLLLGQSLRKVGLEHCKSLDDILTTLRAYAEANPHVPRILAKGWMHSMTPDGVDAAMLDAIDPRPIFVDTKDLHSTWCNAAALAELGIADMPDPAGGKIQRDEHGRPSGVLHEGAVLAIVWPHLGYVASKQERMDCMLAAFEAYHASGYTGIVEMAMDEPAWEALVALRQQRPDMAMRIVAYWLIKPSGTEEARMEQVERAIELHGQFNKASSPDLRIAGIKIICDGIIDNCTAYLSEPYADAPGPPPLWAREHLDPVVRRAAEAGVQIALHAIGDAAIRMACDVLEAHTKPGGRHRIEHIEVSSPESPLQSI